MTNSIKSIRFVARASRDCNHLRACILCQYIIRESDYYEIITDIGSQGMCASCFDAFYALSVELKGGHATLRAIRELKEKPNEQS